MAIFNPDPQQVQEKEYLNQTKAVPQQEANTSLGKFLSSAGETLAAGVKAVDTGFKDFIKDTTNDKVRKERDDFTAALRVQSAQTQSGNVPEGSTDSEGNPVSNPMDILPQGQTNKPLPPSVNGIKPTVENLESARANGAISETYYYQRLGAIAKDMRARYPGYRDYIDKVVSDVTGVDPANAYLKSVIGDINSYITKKNTEDTKTDTLIQEKLKYPGMERIQQLWANKQIDRTAVMQFIAPWEQNEFRIKNARENLELSGAQGKEGTRIAELSASQIASGIATTYDSSILKASGKTQKELDQYFDDIATGKVKPDSVLIQQYGMMYDSVGKQIEAAIRDEFRRPLKSDNPATDGKSLFDLLGPDAAEKKIQEALSLNKNQKERVANSNFGAASMNTRVAHSVTSDDVIKIYGTPDIGMATRIMAAFDKAAPSVQAQFVKEMIAGSIPAAWQSFYQSAPMILTTKPGFAENAGTDALLEWGKREAARKGGTVPPEVSKGIVEMPSKIILDPKASDEVKLNTASTSYIKPNMAILDKFDKDHYDPARKAWVDGRVSAYTTMFSPDVTKEMRRLGEKYPKTWNNYRDSAEFAFSGKIFTREIGDLNQILIDRKDVQIKYDNTTNSFTALFPTETLKNAAKEEQYYGTFNPYLPTQTLTNFQIQQINESLTRLNQGIAALTPIAKASNMEVDAYLYQQFRNAGVTADTLPGIMMDSIAATKKKDEPKK